MVKKRWLSGVVAKGAVSMVTSKSTRWRYPVSDRMNSYDFFAKINGVMEEQGIPLRLLLVESDRKFTLGTLEPEFSVGKKMKKHLRIPRVDLFLKFPVDPFR